MLKLVMQNACNVQSPRIIIRTRDITDSNDGKFRLIQKLGSMRSDIAKSLDGDLRGRGDDPLGPVLHPVRPRKPLTLELPLDEPQRLLCVLKARRISLETKADALHAEALLPVAPGEWTAQVQALAALLDA